MFGPYKEMWKEVKEFKPDYDEYNPGLWSKILFWGVCLWTFVKTTPIIILQQLFEIYKKVVYKYYQIKFFLKQYSPWSKAEIFLCWNKYVESEWYRERLVIMGERYTVHQFINGDWKYFRRKITKKEKWGMFFCPFTYIEKNAPWITCDIGDPQ